MFTAISIVAVKCLDRIMRHEVWDSVRDGETAYRGALGGQPIDVGLLSVDVDSVGSWLGVNVSVVCPS